MSGCLARPLLDSLLRQHLHEVHIRFIHVHIYVFGDRKEIVICCAGSREKKLCVWGLGDKRSAFIYSKCDCIIIAESASSSVAAVAVFAIPLLSFSSLPLA